jgi:hypothetical protein
MTRPTARTDESLGPVDAAREQASKVGQHAGEKGSQLAGTATITLRTTSRAHTCRGARTLRRSQTDVESFAVLEPTADGFRNYLRAKVKLPAGTLLVERATGQVNRHRRRPRLWFKLPAPDPLGGLRMQRLVARTFSP